MKNSNRVPVSSQIKILWLWLWFGQGNWSVSHCHVRVSRPGYQKYHEYRKPSRLMTPTYQSSSSSSESITRRRLNWEQSRDIHWSLMFIDLWNFNFYNLENIFLIQSQGSYFYSCFLLCLLTDFLQDLY